MNRRTDITAISEQRLAALAEAYGADPVRWPAAEQAAARARLDAGAAPSAALQAAAELDRALSMLAAPPAPDPDLRRRILAAAPAPTLGALQWLQAMWRELGGVRLAAPAFVFSLLVGVALAPLASNDVDAAEIELDLIALEDDFEDLLP